MDYFDDVAAILAGGKHKYQDFLWYWRPLALNSSQNGHEETNLQC